jgi:hypothetical protein
MLVYFWAIYIVKIMASLLLFGIIFPVWYAVPRKIWQPWLFPKVRKTRRPSQKSKSTLVSDLTWSGDQVGNYVVTYVTLLVIIKYILHRVGSPTELNECLFVAKLYPYLTSHEEGYRVQSDVAFCFKTLCKSVKYLFPLHPIFEILHFSQPYNWNLMYVYLNIPLDVS